MLASNNRWFRRLIGGGIALAVLAVVAVTAGLIPLSGKAAEEKGPSGQSPRDGPAAPAIRDPVSVTAQPLKFLPVQRTVHTVGSFNAHEKVTVTAEVQGRVEKIYCDKGDLVGAGALLLEINPTDYELAVLAARTALEAELAKLVPDRETRRSLVEKLNTMVADEGARRELGRQVRQARVFGPLGPGDGDHQRFAVGQADRRTGEERPGPAPARRRNAEEVARRDQRRGSRTTGRPRSRSPGRRGSRRSSRPRPRWRWSPSGWPLWPTPNRS